MSTTVDGKGKARLSAAQSRARILCAAQAAFTRAGYDAVGVREIAASAGVDPAMVPRLFGSKETLFSEIAGNAFGVDPVFEGPREGLGRRVADYMMGPISEEEAGDFDDFEFLLRSVGSPTAAPILSAALHADFVKPLSGLMSGADAEARAALITAYLLGFAVLRAALKSPALESVAADKIADRLGAVLQDCLDRPLT